MPVDQNFPPDLSHLTDEQLDQLCRQRERACDQAEQAFNHARAQAAEAIEEIARRGIAAAAPPPARPEG